MLVLYVHQAVYLSELHSDFIIPPSFPFFHGGLCCYAHYSLSKRFLTSSTIIMGLECWLYAFIFETEILINCINYPSCCHHTWDHIFNSQALVLTADCGVPVKGGQPRGTAIHT